MQDKDVLEENKGPPPYHCGVPGCGNRHKAYANRKSLMTHQLWHTTPPERYVTCDHDGCNTRFPSMTMLAKHKSDNHDMMEWPCSCGKAFKHRNSLTYHCKRKTDAAKGSSAATEPHVALPRRPTTHQAALQGPGGPEIDM